MITRARAALRTGPFVLAVVVSSALVLAAPFIGELRRAILQRFPGQFGAILGGLVLVVSIVALVAAIIRIRDRRWVRYGTLALAFGLAIGYAALTRTGDPQVDAVERFHFVEYGLITWLFYRAWLPAGDLSVLLLPVLAGLLVGTCEEWFQWFIPARVGDMADILLNLVAIGCGLLFSIALQPPGRIARRVTGDGRRRIGRLAALAVLVFAGFFDSVHLGHQVEGEGWRFRSTLTTAGLTEASRERGRSWRGQRIARPSRLSAEDQYLTEGHWHVEHRNKAWAAGYVSTAWHENQILEHYFAPVLDTPSYLSPTGHRWSAEHRADARRVTLEPQAPYDSRAQPSFIATWPRAAWWSVALALAALLWLLPWRH